MIDPRFMFHNIFSSPNTLYTITKGAESLSQPLSNAFDYEPTTAALVQADANGVFEVIIDVDRVAANYSTVPYATGYPNGEIPSEVLILGASRHDAALERFAGGTVTLTSNDDGVVFPTFDMNGWLTNSSLIFNLKSHVTSSYTLRFEGFAASEYLSIPALYIGDEQRFGGIDYTYDDYGDKAKVNRVESESGVGYGVVKHRKFTAKPRYSHIVDADWEALKELREFVEEAGHFWYQFDDAIRDEVYFVRQIGDFLPSDIQRAQSRNAQFNLEEVL